MPKRVDSNQASIVKALREVGASVQDLHEVGHGCPDIAVGFRGATYFLEVKNGAGALTPDEERWHRTWLGQVAVVRNIDEALIVIGLGW